MLHFRSCGEFIGAGVGFWLAADLVHTADVALYSAKRHGKKLSRDDILSELRGIDAAILTRSVDIMISRLRGKLGDSVKPPRFIQTIWGRGYSFVGIPETDA